MAMMSLSFLANIFMQLINNDPPGDMIEHVTKAIHEGINVHKSQISSAHAKIATLKMKLGRIAASGEVNLYEGIIQKSIQGAEKALEQGKHGVEVGELMLDMIEEYTDTDPKPHRQYTTTSATSTLGGF